MNELQRQHQQALLGANGDATMTAMINEQYEGMKKHAHQQWQLEVRNYMQPGQGMMQQGGQGLNQSPTMASTSPMIPQTPQQNQQQMMQQSLAQQPGVFNTSPYTQQQGAQRQGMAMHLQGQPPMQGTPQMSHQQLQAMNGMAGVHMQVNNALAGNMAARQRRPQGSQPTSTQSSPSPANASLPVNNNVLPNLNIDYTAITCEEFEDQLREFMKSRNTPLPGKIPSMGSKKINLLLLFRYSMSMGGMESVSDDLTMACYHGCFSGHLGLISGLELLILSDRSRSKRRGKASPPSWTFQTLSPQLHKHFENTIHCSCTLSRKPSCKQKAPE